ncbi:DnaJ domain protein [hydrothermal vent metagenome]|uniref:DnaJ domain protein n=1 Tax=hydrothermal vent metagenome TaxID=652676 RepID=A0A3B0WMD2_9ZZZZ
MVRLIILIAVAAIALILWHKISKTKGEKRKKMILWSIIGSVLAILAVLAVTGHLNIITAMIAGAVALLPRAIQMAKYLPFINRLYQQHGRQHGQQHKQQNARQNNQQQSQANAKQNMSVDEALQVLGLEASYTEDDVVQAHRRMMQKVHPDRGGSDYLAAQINQAKEVLLG